MLEQDRELDLNAFGAPAADEEPEPDENQDAEPTLDDLPDEIRERVAAYYGRQEETRRQALQAHGLDLAPDGRPVIRDPNLFGQWSGQNQPARQQQPAPAPAAPAAEPEGPPEIDPLTMNADDLRRAIEWEAKKLMAPQMEVMRNLMTAVQRRSANDAFAGVRESLTKYGPEIASIVDDPRFAEQYRLHAGNFNPADLEDPNVQESIALSLAPWLLRDRPAAPRREAPAERDAQGRYTARAEVARGLANRQTLDRVAPARGGATPANDGDTAALGQFMQQFSGLHPATAKFKAPTPAEVEAMESESIEAFMAARNGRSR